jgi:hypothetical protein
MRAFKAYERLLNSIHRRAISPGSILLWFGEYKGHEIRKVYNPSAKGGGRRWAWYLNNTVWAPLLRQIEQDYLEWLDMHRRESGTHRAAPVILNPVGEALGPWDDGVASEDESSDDMDSFIATSDEGEISDWETEEFNSGSEHDTGTAEGGSPNAQRGSLGDTDQEGPSSPSFPDVHELIGRATARSRLVPSTPHQDLARPSLDKPVSLDQEDDSDDIALVPSSTSQRTPKHQASTGVAPYSPASLDRDEDSDDEPLMPSNASRRKAREHRSQRNAKRPYPTDHTAGFEGSTSPTLGSKRRRLTPDTETLKNGRRVGMHTRSAGYGGSGSAARTPNTASRSSGKHQEILGWLHKDSHENTEDSSDDDYSYFPTTSSKRARPKACPYIVH